MYTKERLDREVLIARWILRNLEFVLKIAKLTLTKTS